MPPGCRPSAVSTSQASRRAAVPSSWRQRRQKGIGRGSPDPQLVARAPWSRTFSPGWLHLLGHPTLMCPWGLEFGWSTSGILISSVKQLHLEHVVRVFCFSSPWFWPPGGPCLVSRGRSALWGQGMCLCTCQLVPGDLRERPGKWRGGQVPGKMCRCSLHLFEQTFIPIFFHLTKEPVGHPQNLYGENRIISYASICHYISHASLRLQETEFQLKLV